MNPSELGHAPLGREVNYPTAYDASLLFPIERSHNRAQLPLQPQWSGNDIWTAWEISWLNNRGKPVVAVGLFDVPHNSPRLIESKSFKLYLNSFNESRFASAEQVQALFEHDLSAAAQAAVGVKLLSLDDAALAQCRALPGENIDHADIECSVYTPAPQLLKCVDAAALVSETLTSDLLKSNCPVTGQPDWGSVQVQYRGPQIDRHALLQYIVSLRHHTEFHEHCVEKMYCDIWQACQPEFLCVYARYTRRGGLDINPWRSSAPVETPIWRTPRQ